MSTASGSQADPEVFGRITFPLKFTVINVAVLLILTFGFWWVSQSLKETILFLGAGAAAVGTIVTAFYTARTLQLSIDKHRRDTDLEERRDARERARDAREDARQIRIVKQAALRFGERWNDPTMTPVRDILREIVDGQHGQDGELREFIDLHHRTSVIHVLNFLEEIAFAHENQLCDAAMVRNQFEGVFTSSWDRLYPWIRHYRRERDEERLWEKVEAICHEWRRR